MGRYNEGEAVLRLKMDWSSPNPSMWDLVAYRVKYHPHPRTGTKWCIYPSYDFAHCIVDSLEHVDLSLCTLEFETRRESYYWLLEALGMWRPRVWEFSRLNIAKNVLSKRKFRRLIETGAVHGWDDPRLLTIDGLRRRGYPAVAINAFCGSVGASRTNGIVKRHLLEHHCREHYCKHAPRSFAVLRPIRVMLVNVPDGICYTVHAPSFLLEPEKGAPCCMSLSNAIYIDAADFRESEDCSDFRGLTMGRIIGLKYAGLITCTGVTKDASGELVLEAEYCHDRTLKPASNIHWLSSAPGAELLVAEVRVYDELFSKDEPGKRSKTISKSISTDLFLDDVDPLSETKILGALVAPELNGYPEGTAFEFERLGYFVVDKDSTPRSLVFNRVCPLHTKRSTLGGC